jgi:hypothetical protein
MHRIITCLWILAAAIAMPAHAPSSVALASQTAAAATPAAPCTTPQHHAFDFWIGTWDVTQQGQPAGTNRIDRLLDGCALLENWTGKGGVRGHSLNFYDAEHGTWQQTWIDSTGSSLNLLGGFAQGKMTLSSLRTGQRQADRITWTPLPDGTVRQLWEHTDDGGKTWQTAFDGLYRRRT